MVTVVPPAVLPLLVPRLLTDGADAAVTVKRSAEPSADVVPRAVTVTSQMPAACGGVTAAIGAVADHDERGRRQAAEEDAVGAEEAAAADGDRGAAAAAARSQG